MSMLRFKKPNLSLEFDQLKGHNPALASIIEAADVFSDLEIDKHLMITHIFRTDHEQEQLYAHLPPQRRKKSHHQFWNAVDISVKGMSEQEIEKLLKFFNNFTLNGGQLETAIYHKIPGNAFHFHVKYWMQR